MADLFIMLLWVKQYSNMCENFYYTDYKTFQVMECNLKQVEKNILLIKQWK
jgi:hypothetical protein